MLSHLPSNPKIDSTRVPTGAPFNPTRQSSTTTRIQALSGLNFNSDRLWQTSDETCNWGSAHRYGENPIETSMASLTLSDDDARVRWLAAEIKKLGCTLSVDQMVISTRSLAGVVNENGIQTKYDIGVVNWTNSPKSMCSSGVWAGAIPIQKAWDLRDIHDPNATLRSKLERHGYLGDIPCTSDARTGCPLGANFELLIEQGPILPEYNRPTEIVQGAQGCRPSINIIASQVTFTLNIRHLKTASCMPFKKNVCDHLLRLLLKTFDSGWGASTQDVADELVGHVKPMPMTSGAGHDSVYTTSKHCPKAVIFVPCREGVSQNPTEYCS
ncbi:Peptidase M20 [Penicillium lagena]|uniref:Peptidase M20 n=1 Tax=Penicillium lagena TaxID=94218 RepID=UPI00253F8392|nr:Peptidase M20 [Penicillium lagena]KAJ5606009.1 Peptidase M20 [Penicillium lagena]